MRKTIFFIWSFIIVSTTPAFSEQPVYFADPNLKAAVEQELSKSKPTPSDMLTLTILTANSLGITDLTGLEYAKNIDSLDLMNNNIIDIQPLSGLHKIRNLSLENNQINDIRPLSGLHQTIWYLGLSINQITDIQPLSGLRVLQLFLEYNKITNIEPLLSVNGLYVLDLSCNPLNSEAYDVYIPLIIAKHPTIKISYWPCAPLKLRFYIEKNGKDGYQNGEDEPVANEEVYYNGMIIPFQTKTYNDGTIYIVDPKESDYIFIKHRAYSHSAVKKDPENSSELRKMSMFDLYMDTNEVSNNGELIPHKLKAEDIARIRTGDTVEIQLAHPVFCWNLIVALEWQADSGYLDSLSQGIQNASIRLFDITDGHMKLGKVVIYNNAADSPYWENADVRIVNLADEGIQETINQENIKTKTVEYPASYIRMPKTYIDFITGPDWEWYYTGLVHELGHYLLDLSDEYISGKGRGEKGIYEQEWNDYRRGHPDEIPEHYGIMDAHYWQEGPLPIISFASEMSSYNDYREKDFYIDKVTGQVTKEPGQVTSHIWLHDLKNEENPTLRPCWQVFYDRFDNRNGSQTLWNGYDGIRVAISMPPYGEYLPIEKCSSSEDRHGPDMVPFPYTVCEIEIIQTPNEN
jgi:hypothetical protein